MHDLSDSSLALYQANPMFHPVDFSHVPFARMSKDIAQVKAADYPAPETDALRFYLFNHGFHLVQGRYSSLQALPDDLAEFARTHIQTTSLVAKRILFHTMVSTICEMDYLGPQKTTYYGMLSDSYGTNFSEFMHHIHKTNKWHDYSKVNVTCGEMAGGLVSGFAFSDWPYRKPWTRITGLTRQCVFGEISLENFADQSFSLAHWGGSILNKCHLYQCCTDTLYHLLDVQDSGQIPQWVGTHLSNAYVTADIKKIYAVLAKHFPTEMGGAVDKARVSASKTKRDQSNKQIQQWVQTAMGAGGANQGRPPVVPNAIERANRTLLGL